MLRIIIIITLILIAVPFYNKAKDYFGEKVRKAEVIGEAAKKAFDYNKGQKK